MKIDRVELLNALNRVKPGIAKKGIIEQFTHFIFTGKEITTYNDDICITHPFETEFRCSVKAEDLYKVISGITNDLIKMELENGKLLIKTDKTRAGLATTTEGDAEEHIKLLDLPSLKWEKLPSDFIKGLFLCMFSASSDMTQGVLTCVHVNGNKINSAEEVRISEYIMEEGIKGEVLIPARNIVDLVSFDVTEGCFTDNWAHFRTKEGLIFSSRVMIGDYPNNLDENFSVEGEEIKLPKEFKEVIEDMTFMTDGNIDMDKVISLKAKDKKILARAEKQTGWIEKETAFEFDHELEIEINPSFLVQILEKATSLVTDNKKALFVSGNFKHVIMLPGDDNE